MTLNSLPVSGELPVFTNLMDIRQPRYQSIGNQLTVSFPALIFHFRLSLPVLFEMKKASSMFNIFFKIIKTCWIIWNQKI